MGGLNDKASKPWRYPTLIIWHSFCIMAASCALLDKAIAAGVDFCFPPLLPAGVNFLFPPLLLDTTTVPMLLLVVVVVPVVFTESLSLLLLLLRLSVLLLRTAWLLFLFDSIVIVVSAVMLLLLGSRARQKFSMDFLYHVSYDITPRKSEISKH